ncbi:hypothetical protein POTOM_034840 [Populus tomentosa]|uniref:Uncharacterized protein n=1 Tax=Populus tomentosa TaxID=118781 RepID=A0A8X7Z624_POPTO|nr:hypothetical protein POTOM_034840 [Populus tomentosa]
MKMGTRSGFWMGSTYLFMETPIPSLISSWLSIPGTTLSLILAIPAFLGPLFLTTFLTTHVTAISFACLHCHDPEWAQGSYHVVFTGEFGGQSNMAFMCYKKGKVIINCKENTSVSWFSGAPQFSENGGPLQSPIFVVRSLNQSHSQNMGDLLLKKAT